MTTRERKERRIARREEWAEKAAQRSGSRFTAAHTLADSIPLGQPILVGHHSEAHARRDAQRIDANMRRGVEEMRLAEHHASRAAGIATQLDRSIYSDDDNAIEALEARIAERSAQLARRKAINAAIRKGTKAGKLQPGTLDAITPPLTEREQVDLKNAAQFSQSIGYPPYAISNLSADIRRNQQRLDLLRKTAAEQPACTLPPIAGGSAFVVDDDTISTVVTHIAQLCKGDLGYSMRYAFKGSAYDPDAADFAQQLGAAMFALNVESVKQRYPESHMGAYEYGDYTYTYQPIDRVGFKFQALKSLDCWAYQSCEGNCDQSPLYLLLDGPVRRAISDNIIEAMPEYNRARWG